MTNEEQELKDIRDQIKALYTQRRRIQENIVYQTGFQAGDRVRGTLAPFVGYEGNIRYIHATPSARLIIIVEWHVDPQGVLVVSNSTNNYMYSWARVKPEGIVHA